ncbi:MAG: hypothetical protein EA373_03055 [Oceanospirillales bacterium]|nr:MAG: hypothetical protein EA373_03055 [Oceanospirillales bacterium]
MPSKLQQLIHDTISAPIGDIIASVGHGVAEAQAALDQGSIHQTLALYQQGDDETLQMLKDIGYQPTFYTIPEAEGDITLSMKMQVTSSPSVPTTPQNAIRSQFLPQNINRKMRLFVTPVDAGYANRYGYTSTLQARIRFKIVPVPPPENISNLIPTPEKEDEV